MNGEELRRTVLEVVRDLAHQGASLQSATVLQGAAQRLNLRSLADQQALLTFFGDLFRIGYLAWGYNLANPAPPFCHITELGRASLENISRDPSNPDGYLAHLHALAGVDPVSDSYVREALASYNARCFKATAVMIGVASESLALQLRDALVQRITGIGQPIPVDLGDWRIKRILDCIEDLLQSKRASMPRDLFEAFDSFWPAFTQQIRVARNAAGHPTSIDPVAESAVHASLLIFPELLVLEERLRCWVTSNYA